MNGLVDDVSVLVVEDIVYLLAIDEGAKHRPAHIATKAERSGNGFLVHYANPDEKNRIMPSTESLLKAFEDATYYNSNEPALYDNMAYNALKTGIFKCNIITQQARGSINLWEKDLRQRIDTRERWAKIRGNL